MKANRLTEHNSMGRVAVLFMILCLVATLVIGCEPSEQARKEGEMALPVLSPVFQEGDTIPTKYSCQGQDISPPLVWREPRAGTQTFTLLLDDLDAPSGVFRRWILFNIPSNSRELPEALPTQAQPASGALQGKNHFGKIGYGGPCPAPGCTH